MHACAISETLARKVPSRGGSLAQTSTSHKVIETTVTRVAHGTEVDGVSSPSAKQRTIIGCSFHANNLGLSRLSRQCQREKSKPKARSIRRCPNSKHTPKRAARPLFSEVPGGVHCALCIPAETKTSGMLFKVRNKFFPWLLQVSMCEAGFSVIQRRQSGV